MTGLVLQRIFSLYPTVTMRLSTTALTLLLAPLVASESLSFFGQQQQALGKINDNSQVPGESPLEFCQDIKENILVIEHVNLDPNPPVPFVFTLDPLLAACQLTLTLVVRI